MTDIEIVERGRLDKVKAILQLRTEGGCDFPLEYDRNVILGLLIRLVDEVDHLKKQVQDLSNPHLQAGYD